MKCLRMMLILAAALSLAACVAPKAVKDIDEVRPSAFLGRAAKKLKPGGPNQPAWVYMNPKADWAAYHKMLLDPVTFWNAPHAEDQGVGYQDRQMLVNYFYDTIYRAMSRQVAMVNRPGPGTMRVRVGIIKAEPSVVALDVVSTVVPQAVAMSTIKDALTGKPAFVGEAQIAAKVTDAETGELLAAWVAARVGGKQLDQAQFSSWGDVEQAMRFWADNAAYRLCKLQKKPKCQPPKQ